MARFVSGRNERNGRRDDNEIEVLSEFAALYPAIFEYMTLDVFDDGKHRDRATLQMMIEDGQWKCCLNDRSQHRSCWVTGDSPTACLVALEAALASGTPAWRHYKPWNKGKGKGS